MRTPSDEQTLALLTDAFTRWNQGDTITLTMSKSEAWTLMGFLQLVSIHPEIGSGHLSFAKGLGRHIQHNVCDSPELYAFAERGWDPTTRGDQ